jgi:hypothetical protein
LLRRLSNFQKTVTCVCLSPYAGPDSAAAPRLLAGSLDGHVKIFELDDYRVTHASKYPAPVMSLGLSADCSLLAVGMADGMLSVRKHARPKAVQVSDGTATELYCHRVVLPFVALLSGYFPRPSMDCKGLGGSDCQHLYWLSW